MDKVRRMLDACANGDIITIQGLLEQDAELASHQDFETGLSPLMVAAKVGNASLCQQLLEAGAPWNAIDRQGQCAGNFATDHEHWDVVNLLVEWGTRSELILGQVQKSQREQAGISSILAPASHVYEESSTKPDYLQQKLRYNADETALLDRDDDAVMMEWERPLMQAHAQVMMEAGTRVINVGFGMGIIDGILQDQYQPTLHVIIEAHPDVYQKMLADKWDQKPNVKIYHGKWQDVMPHLIQEGLEVDAVFFDTYGEHSFDMEDFHGLMAQVLSKPRGIYSFFNGLAPDNLFFHGVGKCLKRAVHCATLSSSHILPSLQPATSSNCSWISWVSTQSSCSVKFKRTMTRSGMVSDASIGTIETSTIYRR
jgi:protein arginine N-methyltransferase 2